MADQGVWFKLWTSALGDPDLDNLDIADFGRWAKLGTYIKAQGTSGTLVLRPPSRTLCSKLQVKHFDELIAAFHRFPHCDLRRDKCNVSGETIITVSFHNWPKYQGDLSTNRVRKFREMKRSKRRREERRGEEKRISIPPISPKPPDPFLESNRFIASQVLAYLNEKTGKKFRLNGDKNTRPIIARLNEGFTVDELRKVVEIKSEEWFNDSKMFKFLRPETLFGSKFEAYLQEGVEPE